MLMRTLAESIVCEISETPAVPGFPSKKSTAYGKRSCRIQGVGDLPDISERTHTFTNHHGLTRKTYTTMPAPAQNRAPTEIGE